MFARKAFFYVTFQCGGSLSGRAAIQLLNVLGERRPAGTVGQMGAGEGQEVQGPASCGQRKQVGHNILCCSSQGPTTDSLERLSVKTWLWISRKESRLTRQVTSEVRGGCILPYAIGRESSESGNSVSGDPQRLRNRLSHLREKTGEGSGNRTRRSSKSSLITTTPFWPQPRRQRPCLKAGAETWLIAICKESKQKGC